MVPIAHTDPDTPEAVLREALEANRQRYTEQRAAVYRYLRSSTGHPSADEVFTSVRAEISDISLATVYKALETLVSCGLATKLAYGDGSARYDSRTDDHCHSRCLRCGSVRDVEDASAAALLTQLPAQAGFQIVGYRLEVVGFCESCTA